MKQFTILLFIVVFIIFKASVYGQNKVEGLITDSAKLYVEYEIMSGFENDSTFSSSGMGSLFLGEKAGVYVYQYQTPEEFLKSAREKATIKNISGKRSDTEIIEAGVNYFKNNFDLEKIVSVVYVRYYSSPDYLMLKMRQDGDVWISYNAVFSWTPVNEFKTIAGYKCQKATRIDSDGNQNIAWFTEEIPFSVGPLNLEGLPGLILEYHNPGTKRFFKALTISSTDIPEQNFRKWLTGPIVSRDEYREMYEGDSKKLQQMMRMAEIQKN